MSTNIEPDIEANIENRIEQSILEKLRALPVEQRREVLTFVENIELHAERERNRHRPIWEVITELVDSLPPEVWDELPTDGAINHDHYLYGAPKKKVEES